MKSEICFLGEGHQGRALLGVKSKNLDLLKKIGLNVPEGFSLGRYSLEMREDVLNAVEKIGGFQVAVRSSNLLEDQGDASFAGLYESFLE